MKVKILTQLTDFNGSKGFQFLAEKENGEQIKFFSQFLFTKNLTVDISDTEPDGFFDYMKHSGFVICGYPNGVCEKQITKAALAAAKRVDSKYYEHNLPHWILQAIRENKRIEWTRVEGFYFYSYFAEFDEKTMTARSNFSWR